MIFLCGLNGFRSSGVLWMSQLPQMTEDMGFRPLGMTHIYGWGSTRSHMSLILWSILIYFGLCAVLRKSLIGKRLIWNCQIKPIKSLNGEKVIGNLSNMNSREQSVRKRKYWQQVMNQTQEEYDIFY